MKVLGKSIGEYFEFGRVIIIPMAVFGLARPLLYMGGVPLSVAGKISVTGFGFIALLYFGVQVARTGFGTYRHLLPLNFLVSATSAIIISGSIAIAIFTGVDNIYTLPQYAEGIEGRSWFHFGAHLLVGFVIIPIVATIMGAIVMFVTTKLVKAPAAGN